MKKAKLTKQLTIMLNPATFDQIKKITDEKEISIGEWVRDAVERALQKIEASGTVQNQNTDHLFKTVTTDPRKNEI